MQSRITKIAGYTLVGMAIAIGVMGLMVGVATSRLTIYYYDRTISTTRENVDEVKEAIEKYFKINGHYPCPAPLNIGSGDSGYGSPVSNCSALDSSGEFSKAYTVNSVLQDGMWVEGNSGDASTIVFRGAVPFRVLNLPQTVSVDAYGMKIEYAVTRNLTSKNKYSIDGGKISIVNNDGVTSALKKQGYGQFVVLSHGRDRIGAYYDGGGTNLLDCSLSTGADKENCNSSTSPSAVNSAKYMYAQMSDIGIEDSNHYDDYLAFSVIPDIPIWRSAFNHEDNIFFDTKLADKVAIGYEDGEFPSNVSSDYASIGYIGSYDSSTSEIYTNYYNGLSEGDIIYVHVSGDNEFTKKYFKVGSILNDYEFLFNNYDGTDLVSTSDYATGEVYKLAPKIELSVKGDTKASGNVYAKYICDSSTDDFDSSGNKSYCFKVSDLYKSTAFTCPSGQYISRIDSGYSGAGLTITCTTPTEFRCPAGMVVSGISTTAGMTCKYPKAYVESCDSKTVMTCGSSTTATLTASVNGTTITLPSAISGDTYSEDYLCNNGKWELSSSTGSCGTICSKSIDNTDNTTDYTYSDFAIYNGGGKDSYEGTWDVTVSNICESEYLNIDSSGISCVSGTNKEYLALSGSSCSGSKVGVELKRATWQCGSSSWGTPTNVSGSATCIDAGTEGTYSEIAEGCLDDNCSSYLVDNTGATDYKQARSRLASCGNLEEFRDLYSTHIWSSWYKGSCTSASSVWRFNSNISKYTTARCTGDTCDEPNNLGPYKEKGSPYRLGDKCSESGMVRACYSPAGIGVDGSPLYYQYKDCKCN